jgi:hypothetical protein
MIKGGARVPTFHLTRDLGAESGRIKRRDALNPGMALNQPRPKRVHREPQGRHCAHSRNDHSRACIHARESLQGILAAEGKGHRFSGKNPVWRGRNFAGATLKKPRCLAVCVPCVRPISRCDLGKRGALEGINMGGKIET